LLELDNLRILIAEDQALVRQGISALLSEIAIDIIEVGDGEQASQAIKSAEFDLVLLDIGLPLRTGLDVLREVRQSRSGPKIIMLTGDTDRYSPKEIYAAGADGFLYKTSDASHFLETCVAVAAGEVNDGADFDTHESDSAHRRAHLKDQLSSRELQIVKLIVEGKSNKGAAEVLFISEHTVRKHRENINQKLSINSPLALASFAIKVGLV